MKTIWKYIIQPDTTEIEIPEDFEPLSIQMQRGDLCIWAKVTPGKSMKWVKIHVIGTGHVFRDAGKFIGTVQIDDLVFHIFWE